MPSHRHDPRSRCQHCTSNQTEALLKLFPIMHCSNSTIEGHFITDIKDVDSIYSDENSARRMFYLIHKPKEGIDSRELAQHVESMPSQARLAICFKIDHSDILRKVRSLLLVRRHLASTEESFRKLGLHSEGVYGVYPEIDHPTFVFPILTSASRYAESHLLLKNDRKLVAAAHKILTWTSGVNVSLAAVISVGRKP